MIIMHSVPETPFIICLHNTNFFSCALALRKSLQTTDCDFVCALNHISVIVAQFKDVRNKSQNTYHDIHEKGSQKRRITWKLIKATKKCFEASSPG